jgi:cation:H+ antiporter
MDSFASHSLLLLSALALLFIATNWLGQSFSRLLSILNTSPVLKGIILAVIGVSALELVLSVFAVTAGEKAMALGMVLGLCMANLGLGLGLGAILKPLPVDKDIFRREAPVMFVAYILLFILCRDLEISRFDGFLLILFFILFMFMASRSNSFESIEDSVALEGDLIRKADWRVAIIIVLLTLVAMIFAADMIFKSGRMVGKHFEFSGWLTGLIILASLVALGKVIASFFMFKKGSNLSASGFVNANTFNALLVIGVMALVNPIYLSSSVLRFDIPAVLIFSVVLLFTVRNGHIFMRRQGLMAIIGYIMFIAIVIIKNRL